MNLQTNQKVIIRLAKPEDESKIINIQYSSLKVLAAKDYNYAQMKALLRSKSTPRKSPETIFVAEINGTAVGFASLLHSLNMIGAVFVDPFFTRRSIGTLLIKKIEQEAASKKIPVLWVYSSLTGYNFYKANGYRTIEKTYLPLYSTYVPCIKMKKRLLPISHREVILEIIQFNLAVIIIAIAILCWSI